MSHLWARATNARAWAIGRVWRGSFHVRRVVWGRLLARAERRQGEHIRRALIWIDEPTKSGGGAKMKINRVRKQSQPESTT